MVALMVSTVMVTAILIHCSVSTTEATSMTSLQSELRDLINKRKSLNLVRVIIDELDSSLLAMHKYGCDLNLAGFDCDDEPDRANRRQYQGLMDMWPMYAGGDQKRAPCLNFDGTACVKAQTAEELKNRKGWKVGPGRRKRRVD